MTCEPVSECKISRDPKLIIATSALGLSAGHGVPSDTESEIIRPPTTTSLQLKNPVRLPWFPWTIHH